MRSFPSMTGASLAVPEISTSSKNRFINRELSWLSFNERVLEQAFNESHPLLERLRFLSISATNLDEFYMVRVAGLSGQVAAGVTTPSQDGLSPQHQLNAIHAQVSIVTNRQIECWRKLKSELNNQGIRILNAKDIQGEDIGWLEKHFLDHIFPVLTPLAIDPANPFPFIPNRGFALVLLLRRGKTKELLRVLLPVPGQLKRFVRLPGDLVRYIALEDVIILHLSRLFPGALVMETGCCRVLRDSEVEIDEEAEDLVRTFETALKRRRRGSVIRLTHSADMPGDLKNLIAAEMKVKPEGCVAVDGLLGLADTWQLIDKHDTSLLFEPFIGRYPSRIRDVGGDLFAAIDDKDILLHHPYDTFDVVAQFIHQAAHDPDVVAIKQTLYRTSNDSPIVQSLIEAAESGKSVTAMVELKARFDEEANIRWARDLERAGAQVVYGFMDKKTHAKVHMVVRHSGDQLKTYVHFGSGNYHPDTAKVYTDLSLFTCDPDLCRDASLLFNFMTGYAMPEDMQQLVFAPHTLRDTLLALINTEIDNALSNRPSGIWAKLNSLVDGQIIDALYQASAAGVQINLIVRGICCLRPGVPQLSENINVKSIVGRFLEHGRIYCFANAHVMPSVENKVYIASADWMPRNLDRRIETMVPVLSKKTKEKVLEDIMVSNLKDTEQSWLLSADGRYGRVQNVVDDAVFDAQKSFIDDAFISGQE